MVEDGHISNSYQYGPSTYYLDDIHKNDTKNNNDCCVVIMDHGKKMEQDAEDELDGEYEREHCHQKIKTMSNTVANSNSLSKVNTNCINKIISMPAETNVKNTQSQKLPSHYGEKPPPVTYSADTNGSSHIDQSPSQHFLDVTKDMESGSVGNQNIPQEIHKTVIAFGILIFNFFLTTTSLAIIHDRVPENGPLPDTVLEMVDAQDWALIVSEILIIMTTSIMLIIIVMHKYRFIIFRRLFLMLSLLYFMRSVTMFVTVLPVSSKTYICSSKIGHPDVFEIFRRSFTLFFGMGLTINGKHTYCGDYIYSGHTTILVMSYLMIFEYSSKRLVWLHRITWIMSLTGVLMVLLSHSHYTVDVIIGYFVTTRLFWMYHTCANNPFLKKHSRYNYLSREWWFFIFQYFECNVKGSLQPFAYR
ncbi:hypothetical protein PGB90_003913 [Kerria lacca]